MSINPLQGASVMKKTLIALFLSVSTLSAYAQSDLTVSDLATHNDTKAAFKKMVGKHPLPGWVTEGGTSSPNRQVDIDGKHFLVLNACKPHDCAAQNIAVLYSAEAKKMAGVFSTRDEKEFSQTLLWLNIDDDLSIDGKTVLFAALTGSLENHPDQFNFK
ncbi:putative inhibitor of lysozyme [Erwinia amylovora ATCC 49946]|nr:unknown [Erwinia amylovora]CBJ47587.1 putative inhibitor of lysozyme [Erwinia amylovora ATCC 49946]